MAKIKKFALNNSYFKNIRYQPDMPQTPVEVVRYWREKGELPYAGEPTGDRIYHMFCEYQKRTNVVWDQFLTPPKAADRFVQVMMGRLPDELLNNGRKLEIGCGTGMITKRFDFSFSKNLGVIERDEKMIEICKMQGIWADFTRGSFEDVQGQYDIVFGNPPYEPLQQVFSKTLELLTEGGYAIFIVPRGYVHKERPKALVEILSKYTLIYEEQVTEKFERTGTMVDIVVLQKK